MSGFFSYYKIIFVCDVAEDYTASVSERSFPLRGRKNTSAMKRKYGLACSLPALSFHMKSFNLECMQFNYVFCLTLTKEAIKESTLKEKDEEEFRRRGPGCVECAA